MEKYFKRNQFSNWKGIDLEVAKKVNEKSLAEQKLLIFGFF